MKKPIIYADNAATTSLDSDAFHKMKPFLLSEYGNPSQPYSYSRVPKKAIKESREVIANCINANPNEIFFTSGGTESDNWAIKSSVLSSGIRNIITSPIEHHAVLNSVESIKNYIKSVSFVDVDLDGLVISDSLSTNLEKNHELSLISIMTANNEIGSIEPIQELAEKTHFYGSLFHTDAVQAVGHIPIDVKELGVDLLSSSAHKFNGPKGIGFLYIKEGTNLAPYLSGGSQESGHRASTENVASIIGMATALEKNCNLIEDHRKKLLRFEKILTETLRANRIDFIQNGSKIHLPGLLSLSFKNMDGERLLHRLDLKGIMVSTGSACNSHENEISHVLKAINVPNDYRKGTIRLSFGRANTEEEVQKIAKDITEIINSRL